MTTLRHINLGLGALVAPSSRSRRERLCHLIAIPNFQPEYEKTINLSIPLWLMEVSISSAVINSTNDTRIYTDTSFN